MRSAVLSSHAIRGEGVSIGFSLPFACAAQLVFILGNFNDTVQEIHRNIISNAITPS